MVEKILRRLEDPSLGRVGFLVGKSGGGGRSRTYDAADMSHADSDPNLLDLLTELFLEAGDGGE